MTARSQDGLYSYADAGTLPALGRSIVGGKTYLAVETSSSYTQIRDHGSVVWYQVFHVPAGSREKQTVTLKNLRGKVSTDLQKTAGETEPLASLLSQGATLHYTLTPKVDDNSYPLDSYVLTDEGLTAYSGEQKLDFDQYLKGKYSITQVTVGKASHSTADYDVLDAPIVATVRFYGFEDGQEPIQVSTTGDLHKGGETISLNGDKKAKWLTIEYSSPELPGRQRLCPWPVVCGRRGGAHAPAG